VIAEIEDKREQIEELCRRYGVRRLDLFGSAVAAGRFRPEASDLDFLVTFESPDANDYARRFFGFLHALEDLFERRIDLVVDSAITNPYFRESVDETRMLLYAA
jgi:uncharacterized protein